MYKLLILFLLSYSSYAISQDLAVEVGYKYKHTNSANIGLNYLIYDNEGDFMQKGPPLWINGAVSGLTDFNDDHALMGSLQVVWGIYELGLNYSTKNDIEPTIGINLVNAIRMNVGYNIAFERDNNITIGLSLLFGGFIKLRSVTEDN